MEDWIAQLFLDKKLLKMGHFQRKEDLNLGLGWLYYSLARIIRPKTVVIIGSYRGFTPLVFGKALKQNIEESKIIFIDPSFVDNFWNNSQDVQDYFKSFGVDNIEHFLMTTQEFVECETYKKLKEIDLVFIDGYHVKEQAKFDYEAFENLVTSQGMVLFHDSTKSFYSKIYGKDKAYTHTVKYFIDELKENTNLQIFDFPFANGVTLVRKINNIE